MPTYSDVTNTSIVQAFGVRRAQWAFLDSDGCPNGTTGVIAQGSQAGLGIHAGVKRAGGAGVEPRVVTAVGDDGNYKAQQAFGAAELPRLDMTFEPFNFDFYAAMTGTKNALLGSSVSEWQMVGRDTNADVNATQLMLLFNVLAQEADANFGAQRWLNVLYPIVTVYPMFTNHEDASAAEWPYRGIITQAAKAPWGAAFTKAVNGYTRAGGIYFTSRNPVTMHTLVGNAAATAMNLNYSPASDDTGYVVKVFNFDTQTELTKTTQFTVNPGLKKITLLSAPAAAIRMVALFETFDLLVA